MQHPQTHLTPLTARQPPSPSSTQHNPPAPPLHRFHLPNPARAPGAGPSVAHKLRVSCPRGRRDRTATRATLLPQAALGKGGTSHTRDRAKAPRRRGAAPAAEGGGGEGGLFAARAARQCDATLPATRLRPPRRAVFLSPDRPVPRRTGRTARPQQAPCPPVGAGSPARCGPSLAPSACAVFWRGILCLIG